MRGPSSVFSHTLRGLSTIPDSSATRDLSDTSVDIEHIRENREVHERMVEEDDELGPVIERLLEAFDDPERQAGDWLLK